MSLLLRSDTAELAAEPRTDSGLTTVHAAVAPAPALARNPRLEIDGFASDEVVLFMLASLPLMGPPAEWL